VAKASPEEIKRAYIQAVAMQNGPAVRAKLLANFPQYASILDEVDAMSNPGSNPAAAPDSLSQR